MLFFALFGFLISKGFMEEGLGLGTEFENFAYGVAITFLLIPVHEYLHVIAYRLVGARNTYLDMNLRQFYFLALADRSVVNRTDFIKVMLTPFFTITLLCLTIFLVVDGPLKMLPLGLFLSHTIFCSGDFSLLSYYIHHWEKEIYTYDDKKAGKSYFYERLKG
jgi:hypothetical protein